MVGIWYGEPSGAAGLTLAAFFEADELFDADDFALFFEFFFGDVT